MKANSRMTGFSTFEKAEIVVTMDADWQVKTLRTDCKYKVPMLGGLDCVEDITETFSNIGYKGDLPEKRLFEQYFDASIDVPNEDDPDALSVLMDIFQPYLTGDKLNVSLNVSMGETAIVSALVSANIDINNLDNITADVKVGDELYLSYKAGKLLVDYQDFKGSTTLDGIMGLINTLVPKEDGDDVTDKNDDEDNDITSKFTFKIVEGHCVVNMPISLGGLDLEANIYADVTDGKYVFTGADATLGDINIKVNPVEEWNVPNFAGEYPEILGLLDLVRNGMVSANIEALGMSVNAMFDIANKSLCAQLGDLSVILRENVAYLTCGEIKLKLNLSDANKLADIISLFIDGGLNMEMPDISVETVLGALANIKAVNVDGGTSFIAQLGDLSVSINLVARFNGWNVAGIEVRYDGFEAKITPADKFADEIPSVDATQYIDITSVADTFAEPIASLIKGEGYGLNFGSTLKVDGNLLTLNGNVTYDKNGILRVNAQIGDNDMSYADVDAVVANGVIYLNLNGIKVAFKLPQSNPAMKFDLSALIDKLSGINENIDKVIDVLEKIVGTVTNFDITEFNFVKLINGFAFDEQNGRLEITVNAEDLSLGKFGISLAVIDGKLTASVSDLTIADIVADINANVETNVADIDVPVSEDYVTELQIDAAGITAYAQLDLYNETVRAFATLFGEQLLLQYKEGKVYVTYGDIKAYISVSDINRLIAVIGKFVNIDNGFDVDIKKIIDGLSIGKTSNGYSINADVGSVSALIAFITEGNCITFDSASVTIGDVNVVAHIVSGYEYSEIVADDSFVNIIDLAETFADGISQLVNAKGYAVQVDGNLTLNDKIYGITASVNYNGGLHVTAKLALNNILMANVELYLVDNTLYADIAGLRIATKTVSDSNGDTKTLQQMLSQYLGYNEYVDTVLNLIIDIANKATTEDIPKLISGLTFNGSELSLLVNGEVYGMSGFTVSLANNCGLNATVSGLEYKNISFDLNARISASDSVVTVPDGDYSTNLSIKLDEKNTVFANIDLLNGVYRFRIGELYVLYANDTVKINYNNQIFVTGDISYIKEKVKEIDDLVNEFSGANKLDISNTLSLLDNIDIKSIIKTLTVSVDNDAKTAHIGLTALKMPVALTLNNGVIDKIVITTKQYDSADIPNDVITVKLDVLRDYYEFSGDEKYVVIEEVFEDYFETFKKLVHTNSWRFDFNNQSEIVIGTDKYAIAAGSYVEFYYKNTAKDDFKLRANLTLLKVNPSTNKWEQFMTLDVAYIDGGIYVTYNNKLKATVNKDTLIDCYNEVLPELERVVPQVGILIDKLMSAMTEVQDKSKVIDFSTILRNIAYDNGVFSLTVNGGVLLGNLGDVSIAVSQTENGLSLDALTLTYDNIAVNINGMTVVASDVIEIDGETQYVAVNDILAYDRSEHIDLNSLKQLLLAFVRTADMKTQDADGNEVRTFNINGTVEVDLSFTGKSGVSMLTLPLEIKVDINAQGKTFLTVKLSHGNNRIIFKDYGADSYLYYNGETGRFSIIRNAKSGLFGGKKIDYQKTDMTAEEFTANIIDYIFEMVNFADWLENTIKDKLTQKSTNEYGIEDIIKWYGYKDAEQAFNLQLDLSPIDKNLGAVNVDIMHDDNYMLTNVKGNISLVSVILAKFNLQLAPATYGEATNCVNNLSLW